MKITQTIEMATNETELIKELTGETVESVETTLTLPPEMAELAKLFIQAMPLVKQAWVSMNKPEVETRVNGVVVTPPAPKEEEASEDKAA